MHLLVPFHFHDVTSLHPPSFHRNDFSTLLFSLLGQSPIKNVTFCAGSYHRRARVDARARVHVHAMFFSDLVAYCI